MKRRIMVALKEMIEETEQGAYAVDLASKLKDNGYEAWIYADRMGENNNTLKATERSLKMVDNLHLGIQSLKGEFEGYIALDDWAQENVPMQVDIKKLFKADIGKSVVETADSITEKIKKKPKFRE
jgi:hypothetical protein